MDGRVMVCLAVPAPVGTSAVGSGMSHSQAVAAKLLAQYMR